MYFYGFFHADVLTNFLVPLRQAEMITLENFVSAKRDPSCREETFYM